MGRRERERATNQSIRYIVALVRQKKTKLIVTMILPFFINKFNCGRNGTTLFLLLLSLYVIGVVLFGSYLSEGGVEAATNSVRGGRTNHRTSVTTTTTTTGKVPSRKLSPVLDVATTSDVVAGAAVTSATDVITADVAGVMADVGSEEAAAEEVFAETTAGSDAETELKVQQEAQEAQEQEAQAELRAAETIDNEAYEITNEEMQRIQMEIDMVQYELVQAKLMLEEDTNSNTGLEVEEKGETKQLVDKTEAEAELHLQELFVHEKEIVSRELKDIDFSQGSGAIEMVIAVDGTDGGTDKTTTTTTINIVDPLSATHKVVEFTGEKAEKLAAHTIINKDDYKSDEYNKYEQEGDGEKMENENESDPKNEELTVQTIVRDSDGSDNSNNEAGDKE